MSREPRQPEKEAVVRLMSRLIKLETAHRRRDGVFVCRDIRMMSIRGRSTS